MNRSQTALATVCLLWAGMILGISFLEAPVKFTAPSLTRVAGLDVGRHVFGAFHKVELGWALACLALLWPARPPRPVCQWLAVALTILLVQSLWLLPVLDQRVGLILAGQTPPPAPYHVLYIVVEAIKLATLIAGGVGCIRAIARDAAPEIEISLARPPRSLAGRNHEPTNRPR